MQNTSSIVGRVFYGHDETPAAEKQRNTVRCAPSLLFRVPTDTMDRLPVSQRENIIVSRAFAIFVLPILFSIGAGDAFREGVVGFL